MLKPFYRKAFRFRFAPLSPGELGEQTMKIITTLINPHNLSEVTLALH